MASSSPVASCLPPGRRRRSNNDHGTDDDDDDDDMQVVASPSSTTASPAARTPQSSPPSFFAYLRNRKEPESPTGRDKDESWRASSPLLQLGDHASCSSPYRAQTRRRNSMTQTTNSKTRPQVLALLFLAALAIASLLLLPQAPLQIPSTEWSEPLLVVLEATRRDNTSSASDSFDAASDDYSLLDPASPALPQARMFSIGLHDKMKEINNASASDTIRVASYYGFQEQDLHWLAAPMAATDGSVATIAIQVRNTAAAAYENGNYNETVSTATTRRTLTMADIINVVQEYTNDFWQQQQQGDESAPTYFAVHLTGYDYMRRTKERSSSIHMAQMVKIGLGALLLLLMLLVVVHARRQAVHNDDTLPHKRHRHTVLRFVASISFGWFGSMGLWFVGMMVVSWFLDTDMDGQLEQQAVFIPCLAMIACMQATLLFPFGSQETKEQNSPRDSLKLLLTWTAVAGAICFVGFSVVGSHMLGLSAVIFFSAFLLVHATVIPAIANFIRRFTKSEHEDCLSLASPSLCHSPLIRTTADFYNAQFDDDSDDDDHVDLELSSPDHYHSPGYYLERQVPIAAPKSIWFSLSRKVLLHSYRGFLAAFIITQLACFSIGRSPLHIKTTISLSSVYPVEDIAATTWNLVRDKLQRPGHVAPFRLVFDGRSANMSMTGSYQAFEVMHLVVEELMATEEQQMEDASLEHNELRNQGSTHFGMTAIEARALAQHIGAIIRGEESEDDACGEDEKVSARSLGQNTDAAHALLNPLANRNHYVHHRRALYNGIAVLHNIRLPHSVYSTAKFCNKVKPRCPFELLHAINVLDQWVTSNDTLATTVNVELGVDPFSEEGIQWLESARTTISNLEASDVLLGVDVQVLGPAATEHDAMAATDTALYSAMCTIAILVLVAMGLYWQALFVTLLSTLGVALTVYVSFGLASRIFMHSGAIINWRVPPLAAILVACLSVANCLALLSRIAMCREQELEHKSAIAAGLDAIGGRMFKTGLALAIISASSMFLSADPMVKQCLMLIAVASLLDVLVVHFIFVPVALSLAGPTVAWWPSGGPIRAATRLRGFESDEGDDLSEVMRNFESSSEYQALTPNTGHR